MDNQPTKDIFCAKDQAITPHTGAIDGNGEFVFTCVTPDCGRFVKFPADTDKETFEVMIEEHQVNNEGQVSVEAQEAKLAEIMGIEPAPAEQPVEAEQPAPVE